MKKSYVDFYRDGIAEISLKNTKRLDEVLKEILDNKIKNKDYFLKSKYPKTQDFRPDVINYDSVFMDVLKENNIKEKIRSISLRDMSLFHIQIRVVEDENSYMNWHRDTYYSQSGDPVGKTPAGLKIIYYPQLEDSERDRLLYLIGSNRIIFPNNGYDNQLFNILKVKKISTSSDKAILFDTCGMHAVCPERKGEKSIRLIYNFLSREQIIDDHYEDSLHMETMRAFEEI